MPSPSPASREPLRHERGLTPVVAAITIGVLGFLSATVYVETRASAIDRETVLIETNSLPSVELLGAARASLWRLEVAAHDLVEEDGEARREASVTIDQARAEIERALQSELATGPYPGEADLQTAAIGRLEELDRGVARLRDALSPEGAGGLPIARRDVRIAIGRADAILAQILALNAAEGHEQVSRIGQVRRQTLGLLFALNAVCVALSALAAYFAVRSLQRRRELELAYETILESRSAELERFASRVAHDLLSPLSALHFTLVTLQRNADRGLPVTDPLERARACLRRSRALVEGVMDFARSGARPAGGRAQLQSVLAGVIEETQGTAPDVELIVERIDPTLYLACSAGVLTSILSNLVGNAVKHFGDRANQTIRVRAAVQGAMVRIEVEDNGPGLHPDLEGHVFEPYVRSPETATPGLGLGLATVLRFVESHSGRAGVDSAPNKGCIFWFSMPIAP